MTKGELITAIQMQAGISRRDAEIAVKTIFESMADALHAGDRVEIRGLGSLEVRQYGRYAGRNPKTGQPVIVAPKVAPFFKAGKEVRQRINGIPYEKRVSTDEPARPPQPPVLRLVKG